MLANELQRAKALPPKVVTESGMAMLANELQPTKAQLPMVVTESGMVTVFTNAPGALRATLYHA